MTSITPAAHSFIYGRPVRPYEFLNRKNELRTIFNRLRNSESTAVVGEPHIGKTSLLLKIADAETQKRFSGDDSQGWVTCLMDLHPISTTYTPAAFWDEALEPLRNHPSNTETAHWLEQADKSGYSRRSLERFFEFLGRRGQLLVLLLDEFERLLHHRKFQDPAFFALLRSLSSRTGGLALVLSSRLSVTEMNQRGQSLLNTGSPFFNHMIEMRLRLFDEKTADSLLSRAGDGLSPNDQRFIRRATGCHPFLLQAMAASLAEVTDDDRHARAAEWFSERVSFHFDDLWRTLDDRVRTTTIILSLIELGNRALGQDFDYSEIDGLDAFGADLRRLAQLELAVQVRKNWEFDQQHVCSWRGEHWTIKAQVFTWWVGNMFISGAQAGAPDPDTTLVQRRLKPDYSAVLRNTLTKHFDKEELRTLCVDLGIEYDDLLGNGRADKARELIAYLERHGRLNELVDLCEKLRPLVVWTNLSKRIKHPSTRLSTYDDWLAKKCYLLLLNEEQWVRLENTVRNASQSVMFGIKGLAQTLSEELRGKE